MRIHQERFTVKTTGRALVDVTAEVRAVVERAGVGTGLATLFVEHTSAGLVIQENYDPAVRRDLQRWIEGAAPESSAWEHDDEGPDDMPAHVRTVLTRTSESVPITDGKLALGTWQAIYLWEHRAKARTRTIAVTVVGE